MEPGTFLRKLQKLNPRLKVFCGEDRSKPAGLFWTKHGEYVEICGVDKGFIPERRIVDPVLMRYVKRGWREVLNILITKGLVDRTKAEKVFMTHFDEAHKNPPIVLAQDPILRAIQDIQERPFKKDELVDIGRELAKREQRTF